MAPLTPFTLAELQKMDKEPLLEAVRRWNVLPGHRRVMLNTLAYKVVHLTHYEKKKVGNVDAIMPITEVDENHVCIKKCTEFLSYSCMGVNLTLKHHYYAFYLFCLTRYLYEIEVDKLREKLSFELLCHLIAKVLHPRVPANSLLGNRHNRKFFDKWHHEYLASSGYQNLLRQFRDMEEEVNCLAEKFYSQCGGSTNDGKKELSSLKILEQNEATACSEVNSALENDKVMKEGTSSSVENAVLEPDSGGPSRAQTGENPPLEQESFLQPQCSVLSYANHNQEHDLAAEVSSYTFWRRRNAHFPSVPKLKKMKLETKNKNQETKNKNQDQETKKRKRKRKRRKNKKK